MRLRRALRASLATALFYAASSGCTWPFEEPSGSPGASFSISADAPWLVVPGASSNAGLPITIVRDDHTLPLTFTASTTVSGLSFSFAKDVTAGSENMLFAQASSSAALGCHRVKITATGGGYTQSFNAFIQVASTPTPDHVTATISAPPPPLYPGIPYTFNLSFVRVGFTGGLSLSATGLPTGSKLSFSATPVWGNAVSFTLQLPLGLPDGAYPLNLFGVDQSGCRGTVLNESTSFSVVTPPIVAPCADPVTCYTPSNSGRSYYAGGSCTGDEFAVTLSSTTSLSQTWDGYGVIGLSAPAATIMTSSFRTPTGQCVTDANSFSVGAARRVYRDPPDPSCNCGLCSTCVAGACVPVQGAEGMMCEPSTCFSATVSRSFSCQAGACVSKDTDCGGTCFGAGFCGGGGS